MVSTTVIYIGPEDWVAGQVRRVADQIQGCILFWAPDFSVAEQRLRCGGVGMVIVSFEASADPAFRRLLAESGRAERRLPVVVIGAPDDPAVRAGYLLSGTVDCLSQPINWNRLRFLIDLLTLPARCCTDHIPAETDECCATCRVDGFLFASAGLMKIIEQLCAVAPLDSTVMLTGETGTGKTHLARVLHSLSPRRDKPFVVVHCGALPATLFESEMFGHVRGSFTGADQDRIGRLAEAADGTLFLDEIDSVPLEAQAKLLRAVEDREFEPVGSSRPQRFMARLVVATNRPLEDEVKAGRFRADLYYRLNVVQFNLPPLREQRELVRPLVQRFLGEFAQRNGCPPKTISAAAMAALEDFDWPGNVRELRNVVERCVACCPRDVIDLNDLPEAIRRFRRPVGGAIGPHPSFVPGGNLCYDDAAAGYDHLELRRLIEALRRHKNNRTAAAADLGISRVTFYKKLRRYGLI